MGLFSFLPGRVWAVLGAVLAVSLLAWGWDSAAFARGVASAEARHNKALVASVIRAQAQAREIALQDAEVSLSASTERERIRTVYRDREKEIVNHVPFDCDLCRLSPTGLGVLNDALSNRKPNTPDPGSKPPPGAGPSGDGRNRVSPGNGGIVDIRQRKVL